jgi:hypothetical protein
MPDELRVVIMFRVAGRALSISEDELISNGLWALPLPFPLYSSPLQLQPASSYCTLCISILASDAVADNDNNSELCLYQYQGRIHAT